MPLDRKEKRAKGNSDKEYVDHYIGKEEQYNKTAEHHADNCASSPCIHIAN